MKKRKMNMLRTYPSKIMLAGEYGVVVGGAALTIPFHHFSARVRTVQDIPAAREQEARQSLNYLQHLFGYIQSLPEGSFHAAPDLDRFASHLQSYWLDVNIPVGYGLGSSGAVSAAVYDLFFPGADSLGLQEKKEDLAAIESYFHGRSSGLDALTCREGAAIRVHSTGSIEKVHFKPSEIPGGYRFFLLNSQESFDTGPLVKHFLNQMEDPEFKHSIEDEYLRLNQKLIEALLGELEADPALLVKLLSDFQLRFFRRMIPEKMTDLWIEGLVSDVWYLKLNGSGGGYMLGISHESFTEILASRWGGDLLWVDGK